MKGIIELQHATTAVHEKSTLRILNTKNSVHQAREWMLVADSTGEEGDLQAFMWAAAINAATSKLPQPVTSQWEVVETMPVTVLPRVVPKKK